MSQQFENKFWYLLFLRMSMSAENTNRNYKVLSQMPENLLLVIFFECCIHRYSDLFVGAD